MGQGLRECSDEQFSDGTSIDFRFDKACDDIVSRFNALRRRDIHGLMVPQTRVYGWSPIQDAPVADPVVLMDHHMPWMRVYNSVSDFAPGANAALAPTLQNPWRHKGHKAQDIVARDWGLANGQQFAWTVASTSDYPLILNSVTLWMYTDSAGGDYQNPFQWPAGTPFPPNEEDDWVKDFNLVVASDHPFAPEDRSKTAMLASMWERPADGLLMTAQPVGGPVVDALPTKIGAPHNLGPMDGVCVRMTDLNCPLPAGCRWRIGVVLPMYDEDVYDSPWTPDAQNPNDCIYSLLFQRFSLTATVYQEVI